MADPLLEARVLPGAQDLEELKRLMAARRAPPEPLQALERVSPTGMKAYLKPRRTFDTPLLVVEFTYAADSKPFPIRKRTRQVDVIIEGHSFSCHVASDGPFVLYKLSVPLDFFPACIPHIHGYFADSPPYRRIITEALSKVHSQLKILKFLPSMPGDEAGSSQPIITTLNLV